jgi:IS5 family transposase
MEEALHDVPLYREFVRLDDAAARLPDETTTSANVHDLHMAGALLHGQEQKMFADAAIKACTSGPKPLGP